MCVIFVYIINKIEKHTDAQAYRHTICHLTKKAQSLAEFASLLSANTRRVASTTETLFLVT